MTRLLILIFIVPFVLMAIAIIIFNIGNASSKDSESVALHRSISNALSIASGGFGFLSVFLIIFLILIDEDTANLSYNITLLIVYAFLLFKAQMYTLSVLRGNQKNLPRQ